jgi:hypothetical protein
LDSLEDSDIPLTDLFLYLLFKDGQWRRWLRIMNDKVETKNNNKSTEERPIPNFTQEEFITGHALLIGSADCADRGRSLWEQVDDNDEAWHSITTCTNFSPYMKLYRFKQFWQFIPRIWEEEEKTKRDPWWQFGSAVENFNQIQKNNVLSSEKRVLDETMSAFRPRTTRLGGLPNISYILWKPEPLGTKFKTSVCPKLNVMTYMELCEGKDNMKSRLFHTKLGGTTACAVHMSQGTCQTDLDNKIEVVKGDLWFGSVKTVLSIKEHCPKCKESVFQVKTAHKLFPKQFID